MEAAIEPRQLQCPSGRASAFALGARIAALAALFTSEVIVLSVWLDNDALAHRGIFLGFLFHWGAWTLRGLIAYAVIFVSASWLRSPATLREHSGRLNGLRISRRLLVAHVVAMLAFLLVSSFLYGSRSTGWNINLLAIAWCIAGISAIVVATFAFLPARWLVSALSHTGRLWLYTLAVVMLACVTGNAIRSLWQSTSQITFFLVELLLRPIVSHVIANPATKHIGTTSFAVDIAPECSGFEGVGLMLGFSVIWLTAFRAELRFPRALLLVPVGVLSIFLLNAVRIAILILIGNAGASAIALGGFHSQAGWISFNAVALSFCVAAGRLPWLQTGSHESATSARIVNPSIAYLLPFASIMAAAMLSRALAQDFEWFYPLRLAAALIALWYFRRVYTTLDWRIGWWGPALGTIVFAVWILLDSSTRSSADAVPAGFAAGSTGQRTTWLLCRIAAAVITVPIAEELAFRGYLIRRFVSRDFDLIDPRRFSWPGLLISSLAFGLLHGDKWIAGTLAGLIYATALLRRGRIGEAVAAHGTTNALLAAYVLAFHKWHLW